MDYLSLCLICKDENDYLSEWLDYHILMGVDRFYIYDNESQVSLRESLKEYIERGWVVVVDIPGKAMQLYAYDHCLQTFGANTFWLGFIDTDEFLVPKITQDLKEFLKAYEAYGGLAVSSLFFGSNAHIIRPAAGQIASYTRCTQSTIGEYEVIKSIVQPGMVLMPNSPHDFIYKENAWCVNEGFLRVDFQRFPKHTEKIQLNHYFCRSEQEIDLKLRRGNSQAVVWPRQRFDALNLTAIYEDTNIHQTLEAGFQQAGIVNSGFVEFSMDGLLEKMAILACTLRSAPLELAAPGIADSFRPELTGWLYIKDQWELATDRADFYQQIQLGLDILKLYPHYLHLYVALAIIYLRVNDVTAAWQALSKAWQLSPNNNYNILCGMSLYFLYVENFSMAENTCRLVLELSPHDMAVLGLMVQSLIGQERFEDALKVGVPVLELVWTPGWELSAQMGVNMVKKLADYLLEKKDYALAVRLWEAGVKCKPDDVNSMLELIRTLLHAGDKTRARQVLSEAQALEPRNEVVLSLLSSVRDYDGSSRLSVPNRKKRRH
ncbi:MAG: glycosyltransferase family 92 protein [Chloroflexi bacterium]|jgi:tetratricopeptide (TPR) repeat protein|nr:glycosyltransferase family 92 protein [Chloroflexota bacterium]